MAPRRIECTERVGSIFLRATLTCAKELNALFFSSDFSRGFTGRTFEASLFPVGSDFQGPKRRQTTGSCPSRFHDSTCAGLRSACRAAPIHIHRIVAAVVGGADLITSATWAGEMGVAFFNFACASRFWRNRHASFVSGSSRSSGMRDLATFAYDSAVDGANAVARTARKRCGALRRCRTSW